MKKNLLTLIIMLLLGFFGLVQAQVPLPYTEGFEEGLGSWTLSNCHSSTGISTSASYIHSGSQTFAFHWTTNPPQYLISPEITGATGGVNVEFYYKAGSTGSYSETFQVGYSTSTNAVDAFTFGEEITAPPAADWALYSNTFPAGTKYVAVACTSYDALYFCVDDFTFEGLVEAELTVHDATSSSNYVPVYGTWADAYLKCEMVYPASELAAMAGGEISGITYYLSSPASDVWTGTWEVFMYEVDNTTIDNFYGEDRSIVYTGALDGTGATMTINFDTPYTYNGGNLLVGVYQIVPGNWKSAYFNGETVTGASVQGYSSTGLDYISATQRNFLPKTTFSYLTTPAPCPDTAMVITPVDGATDIDEANTMLSWQLGNNTQQYCLLFGTDPSNMDTLVPWTGNMSNQYLFNNTLNPCTTYYWQVGERNDFCADDVFSNIWSFTTASRLITIAATPNPMEGGSVNGADSYFCGTTCTLVATPATGYRFINWTESDTVVSSTNTLTFTVTNDRTLVANFSLTQLDVFADYHPNPADSSGEVVRVHWEEQNAPYIEDFESGDFTKFDWQLDATHPWTITTKNPYEGTFCMKSGGSGVAGAVSNMTVTVDIPDDGIMSFFGKISSETSWDYGYFYIDGVKMKEYSGQSSWGEKKFNITQGTHTFQWSYCKDYSNNYNDDCFYVDCITFYKEPRPVQPGWHTYCESEFNNAVGSNLTTTPSWAYEYPTSFLETDYAGWSITKVSLFSDDMYIAVGGNYTCNIYVGGSEPATGTMVSTITVDVPSGQNAWIDWDLTTPVNVTGNEPIWIVWTANTTVSSWPAGCCNGLNDYGTWWNGGNGWEHLTYGTWTMRQYFDNGAGKGIYSYAKESTRDIPHYRVYRALCNESGSTLLTDNVSAQEYLDNDWVSLDHGFYKYGVSIEDGPIFWSDSIENIAVYYNINASANPTMGGSVTGTGSHERYTTCTLTATPSEGYHFLNWAQNGTSVSTDETFSFTVTQDSTFVANFGLNSYTLTVNYLYADGNTAAPTHTESVNYNAGYSVDSPEIIGYTPDIATVAGTMGTSNVTVDVVYSINSYTLTINYLYADGNTAAPTHTETINYNASYNVVSPEITGYTPDIDIVAGTMGVENVTVDVTYTINSYEITATVNPANSGSVEGTGTYNHFETCTLTAIPATGYHFVNWTMNGEQVGTNTSISFEVTGAAAYVANFELNTYNINAMASPISGGSVTGAGTYEHFETCTLTATPAEDFHFVNWTKDGLVLSTNATYSFEVTGPGTYVAHFEHNHVTITAYATPTNSGSVTGSGEYVYGSTCTLTATPAIGRYFVKWTKGAETVSTEAVYSFEATETATYRAHFEYINYTISAEANPEEGGTITGTSNMAHYNSTCQLVAQPNTGYHFVNWTLNGVAMSTDEIYDFTVTGSAHYVANFSMDSYEVTVVADPAEGGTVTGAGTYDSGTMATVSVTPNENYLFENWTLNGTVVSEDLTYSFVVTENCELVAHLWFFDEVGEHGASALSVYPNPTQDKVNLRGVAMHSVKVFDAMGQMVITKVCDNTENVELDLSGLAPGFYTVSVRTTDGALLDKVVIKK